MNTLHYCSNIEVAIASAAVAAVVAVTASSGTAGAF